MTAAVLTALLAAQPIASATADAVPDWIQLLPAGQAETYDGRGPYRIADPAAVIAASLADPRGLVVDENHSTDIAAPKGEPAPARGWITELDARADGIWGRVEWTPTGRALLADRAYRGVSPVITHDKDGRVAAILRASLVNRPNLRGLAALHQEDDDMALKATLAELLGLKAEATDDEIVSAVRAAKDGKADQAMQSALSEIGAALGVEGGDATRVLAAAKAAKAAGPEQVTALQAEVASLAGKLKTATEAQAKERATTFVDAAIAKGHAGVKPLRDHYIARHMADPETVAKEIAAMPVIAGLSVVPAGDPPGAEAKSLNADQERVAKLLGIPAEAYLKQLQAEQGKAA